MGRREKLLTRFLSKPRDFTWQELVTLLAGFGYKARRGGKTGGSRVRFVHLERGPICLHKPHPGHLRRYQLEQIIELLREEGLI
ncbi:MAG: type II toxin-antitoxin system HicA family toxin [bacterium]|nr:type II toxin-antitoxin system HicA family toxin [bacterium]